VHQVPTQEHGAATVPAGASPAIEPLRLLLLDASSFDAELLDARLQRDGLRFVLHQVETESAFRNALAQPWDLILCETELPQMSARRALAILAEQGSQVPVVIVTAVPDESVLTGLLDAGAVDYVLKTRLGRLVQALRLAIERARLAARLADKQRRMARLSIELIHAQEAERKALARELHDELGQRLTALNMLLHRSQPWFTGPDALGLWRQAERELGSLVGLVRDMSVSLRPPGLDFFGLEPTIEQLLTRRFEGGPAWVFEYAGLPRRLDPTIEISVYRIVQESVTNIVRHARAQHVVVEINGGATGAELELIVRDDGAGFDASHWREHAVRAGRAGLAGMCERVQLLGGAFEVESSPGQGARIWALLPLQTMEGEP
jgi:signal transduction histidine kinase